MKTKKYSKLLLLGLITTTFIACGGGGSSSNDNEGNDTKVSSALASNEIPTATSTPIVTPTPTPTTTPTPTPNQKPTANAGEDQNVTFGNQVVLDAKLSSDSDGSIVKYEWTMNGIKLTEKESIVLENFPKEGEYNIELKVTDDKGATDTDSMKILTYLDTVVVLNTIQGDIELEMKSKVAPKAVENFVTHSRDGYYDGVIFHRVIKNFMIQGGDPKGTGYGGESIWGGKFGNEIDPNVTFDKPFLLAMAKGRQPSTNGSQFFITTSTKYSNALNGNYTIFGEVIDGNETVTKIENVKTSGKPYDRPDENQTIIKAYVKFEVVK